MTNCMNLKIKTTHSFIGANRDRKVLIEIRYVYVCS
jgi:hypothetical protein